MYFKKTGYPKEDEIVYCTVKKILYHSVFAILDEYENKEGMIHISEIAPGRIRNIRDYVKEGKKLVCKVLRINREKGHIDLSLRRVPMSLRNQKVDEIKQEAKSEKIVEAVAEKLKVKTDEVYKNAIKPLVDEYELISPAFMDVVMNGEKAWEGIKVDPKMKEELITLIEERIKPPEVRLEGILILRSDSPEGVEIIKEALLEGEKLAKKKDYDLRITYVGSPNYKLEVVEQERKTADEQISEVAEVILDKIKKLGGEGEFKR